MILAGDIGGTKVNLALFSEKGEAPSLYVEKTYPSRDYPGLISILERFLKETQPKLTRVCLGVAGPVQDGRSRLTHLPWVIDIRDLKPLLQTDSIELINDMAVMACAVPHLVPDEVETLQPGEPDREGKIGVLAAGTGLGQAFLVPFGEGRYRVVETEGGQCDFPPRNDLEAEVWQFLSQGTGRVAIEDVLSGPGLVRLFDFFRQRYKQPEPDWLKDEFQVKDPASVISQSGMMKTFRACESALDMFVSVYGAAAGNLALQIMGRGGIYLGGGIAPRILPLLKSDLFLSAFRDKGRFREFMTAIPVKVIMNERASLMGAAYFALGEKVIR